MSMKRAIWNGAVLAESNQTRTADGYTYFPPSSVKREYLRPSDTHTRCGWKGTASYYDVVVGGKVNSDAAWYYPTTSDAAKFIEGWVGFWHGVEIRRDDGTPAADHSDATSDSTGECVLPSR